MKRGNEMHRKSTSIVRRMFEQIPYTHQGCIKVNATSSTMVNVSCCVLEYKERDCNVVCSMSTTC